MNALPWITLFLPLFAASAIALGAGRNAALSARLSVGAIWIGFLSIAGFIAASGFSPDRGELSVVWLEAGSLAVDFGIRLDPLSLMMTLVVTGVGGLIHVYSMGYMKDDPSYSRYFASLSLFTFSMLGIVLSNNLLQLFVFWELVGVSSYLLIGFWFERPAAADASKKAFIVNRIGDVGFLLGILVVWSAVGTLNFAELEARMGGGFAPLGTLATAAGLLLFCGALGKSAQFPLHVWLPDAMEGPTPVSALIHAATMVAAGVYMLCRIFFLLNAPALATIGWIGGLTALLAAVIAIQQNDIKRILAYSTLSQLGYMVMAVGLSGPTPAMHHLTTHAFFKALLFLGAGSVIVALHHEQDIWRMGGLRRRMPLTFWTFMAGTLALCGVPPLSGFFSKDEVLLQAYERNPALFGLGAFVAVLTTFYMFRLVFVAFFGAARSEASQRAHESPTVMTLPLLVLAALSVLGGFLGIEAIYGGQFHPGEASGHGEAWWSAVIAPMVHAPAVALFSLFAIALGFSAAYGLYWRAESDPLPRALGVFSGAMRDRFYIDEIYQKLIVSAHDGLARISAFVDRWIIDGLAIRGSHGVTELVGRGLRMAQTGSLQTYALLFGLGAAALLYFALCN